MIANTGLSIHVTAIIFMTLSSRIRSVAGVKAKLFIINSSLVKSHQTQLARKAHVPIGPRHSHGRVTLQYIHFLVDYGV